MEIVDKKISELKERKRKCRLTNKVIAARSGIPVSTVQKIFSGSTRSPRHDTLSKIEDVIVCAEKELPGAARSNRYDIPGMEGSDKDGLLIKEDSLAYDIYNGSYDYERSSKEAIRSFWRPLTIDDYYALPDNIRAELIDGRLYCMTAPDLTHQDIQMKLVNDLFNYISKNRKNCRVWAAPVDVRLDNDDYTMLQPDILAICYRGDEDDRLEENKKRIDGAPDFVLEILSPSSVALDTGLKLNKYKKAGVHEYWIVDPGKRIVMVYDFFSGTETEYSFVDKIPVAMTGGELVIDFAEVNEYINY